MSCLISAGCHPTEKTASPPHLVVAAAVYPDSKNHSASLPGTVEPRYSTPLSFRIAGKITERRARIGDTVKAGQILAQLDSQDLQHNVAATKAQLDAAAHRADYAKAQLARDSAQAREDLIAAAQLEQTQDAYSAAVAQREQARQQFALARNQLRYATLTADHAGLITTEDADTGQNVSAGQPIYHLAWSNGVDIVCNAPEEALAALAVGSAASVELPALPGKRFDARVREVAPAADPQSRTFRVKLTVQAPSSSLRFGMTANVEFAHAQTPSGIFTLPVTALFHDGAEPAVWVVRANDQTLELRRVRIVRYGENTVSISSGLSSGERVVLQGAHTVSAGEKVRITAPLHDESDAS